MHGPSSVLAADVSDAPCRPLKEAGVWPRPEEGAGCALRVERALLEVCDGLCKLRREVVVMSRLRHASVLPLLAACALPQVPLLCLMMPYAPHGSLDNFLKRPKFATLVNDPLLQTRIAAQVDGFEAAPHLPLPLHHSLYPSYSSFSRICFQTLCAHTFSHLVVASGLLSLACSRSPMDWHICTSA